VDGGIGIQGHSVGIAERRRMINPTLEVLSVEIKHERELREKLEKNLDERDTKNKEAIASALAAQKASVADAFASSEKAIVKAENAQNAHNVLANGLQGRLDSQASGFIGRPEFNQRFSSLEEKVNDLKLSRSETTGKDEAIAMMRTQSNWIKGMVAMIALGIGGFIIDMISRFGK
jgi:hypothetical protein